jgi:D-alanine transaminase
MSTVFLNGNWIPLEQATISVLDRGFIFGDGVYEVIPVHNRHPFRAKQHLLRLQYSLDGIQLKNPHSLEEWLTLVDTLIAKHDDDDQNIYLQITRGVAPRNHDFPINTPPTIFMMSNPLKSATDEQISQGLKAVSVPDQRWGHCNYKTTSLLGNILATQYATDRGCGATIQFRDGFLTEAGSSNILIVRQGAVLAPIKDHRILHGITMDALSETLQRLGIIFQHRDISEEETRSADEIWITSSTKDVLAITHLDEKPIRSGNVGDLFKTVHAAFQKDIHDATHPN